MTRARRLSRRRFIASSVAAASAAAAGGLLAGCGRFQPSSALSADERRLVEALADQVVPPDQDAGGRDAGVADFIDIQLRGPYRRFREVYRDGLARLERTSQQLRRRSFVELPFDDQTALLRQLESDQVPADTWEPRQAGEFFRLVCDHCLQGYYGSPRHGGNRGGVSWKMLRLDYPQVAGRVTT
jgi:gluconate 2-dehydrogenase gamma chain